MVARVRAAATPRRVLYRLGMLPDPFAWSPWQLAGRGRFDDPEREFRVLYAAEQRRACFVESLAPYRLSLEAVAHLWDMPGARARIPARHGGADAAFAPSTWSGVVPGDWLDRRCIGRLRLAPRQRWLDLRAFETRERLRAELASSLLQLGLDDLDVSGVRGPSRRPTQAIPHWACEQGCRGIAYRSRFDDALDCWAIFEGAVFTPVAPVEPITPGDPDLRAVTDLFNLSVSGLDSY